jgi:hypothetical protein
MSDDPAEQAPLSDADSARLEALAEELGRVLGVGVGVGGVEVLGDRPVRLRTTLLADGKVRDVEAEGPTLEEACRALVEAAAKVRLDGAFWQIVGDI